MQTNKQQLVPALRFPEFEGSWERVKTRKIAKISSGSTPLRSNKKFFKNGNITWVKTTDLNNHFINDSEEHVTPLALEETSLKIKPKGSILIAMYGGFNQIGRTGLLAKDAATNQALSVLEFNQEKIVPFYALSWFNKNVDLWKRFAASSRKDPNITSKDVGSFPFAFPSLPEQQKIAHFLTLIDRKITLLQELAHQLQIFKKGLMQQLLTGKWRFQEFIKEEGLKSTKLGVIPKSWTIQNLGKIANIDKNKLDSKTPLDYKFSYITLSDVKEGKINDNLESFLLCDAPSRAKKIVKKGNVLLATVRPNLKGFAYFNKEVENIVASTGFSVIEENGKADTRFIYHHLYTRTITAQIYAITVGSNYPAINSSDVKKLKIPLPTLPEQKKIANFLSNLDQQIQLIEAQVQARQEHKKGLLQHMLV